MKPNSSVIKIKRTKRKFRTSLIRKRIFSGDESIQMWNNINNAKTIADLRRALYSVCCRLQEFEGRVERLNFLLETFLW